MRKIYNTNKNTNISFHPRVKREEKFAMVLYGSEHDRG